MPTEPLSIPELNLSGLLPEQQNAVVKLDLAMTAPAPGGGATADFTAWPEFHNGVAAGSCLCCAWCHGPPERLIEDSLRRILFREARCPCPIFSALPITAINACAPVGLRLALGGAQMTRTWIVYNKPKEPSYTHAGMLMGLGLTGVHLLQISET